MDTHSHHIVRPKTLFAQIHASQIPNGVERHQAIGTMMLNVRLGCKMCFQDQTAFEVCHERHGSRKPHPGQTPVLENAVHGQQHLREDIANSLLSLSLSFFAHSFLPTGKCGWIPPKNTLSPRNSISFVIANRNVVALRYRARSQPRPHDQCTLVMLIMPAVYLAIQAEIAPARSPRRSPRRF